MSVKDEQKKLLQTNECRRGAVKQDENESILNWEDELHTTAQGKERQREKEGNTEIGVARFEGLGQF